MKALAAGLAGALLAAPPPVSKADADRFAQKLTRIVQADGAAANGPRLTEITEAEVNAFLHFRPDLLPVGVTEPSIAIQDQGRLSGRVVVDLDAIRRARGRGSWFDPVSYLRGSLPLTASGVLTTSGGRGQFQLEHAAVSGVPIPKSFLQEIVTYYTRSPGLPGGIDIDDPFDLPAEIQRIDADSGRALITQ